MSRKVQISVERADDTVLDMPATLADDDASLLDDYLGCVDRLLELPVARDGVPCSFQMRVENGAVTLVSSEVPPAHEIAALLHLLRPLILQEERTSYQNVSSLLCKRFPYPYLRGILGEQRRLFDGRNNQELVRITSNDALINSEHTLFDWLNGYEYHRDQDKREKIEALHRVMPLEHSMPILVGLLGDKVQAISQLAGLIAVILDKQQSIQVTRNIQPVGEK